MILGFEIKVPSQEKSVIIIAKAQLIVIAGSGMRRSVSLIKSKKRYGSNFRGFLNEFPAGLAILQDLSIKVESVLSYIEDLKQRDTENYSVMDEGKIDVTRLLKHDKKNFQNQI